MNETKLYTMLVHYKGKFTRQQYLTIKGQIKAKDYVGAYKGIVN